MGNSRSLYCLSRKIAEQNPRQLAETRQTARAFPQNDPATFSSRPVEYRAAIRCITFGRPAKWANTMVTVNDDLAAFLAAVRALHSSDPAIRRRAIATLLQLASGESSVQIDAERAVTEEFGPYAVTDGLGGCSAPVDVVEVCDGNCPSCVWLWQEQPASYSQCSSVMPKVADLQPALVSCRSRRRKEIV